MLLVRVFVALVVTGLLWTGCQGNSSSPSEEPASAPLTDQYATVQLAPETGGLSDDQTEVSLLLIEAAQAMDAMFWEQAYGNRDSLLQAIEDPQRRRFARINYGPWNRLANNEPFVDGVGPKPPGANFYPAGLTRDEFDDAVQTDETLAGRYTMVRRLPDGSLAAIPYYKFFARSLTTAADRLREAAALAEDPLAGFLEQRAEALVSDDYRPSTRSWLNVEPSEIDLVIGAVRTKEDQLFGHKAAAEAIVLRKDVDWSRRLQGIAERRSTWQQGLPIPDEHKQEVPGRDVTLGVYDALYMSGRANAGPKPTALHLPADEGGRDEAGARRLALRNVLRAKFDESVRPTSERLIAGEQRSHVTFGAFFEHALFHEVAHGLGLDPRLSDGEPAVDTTGTPPDILENIKADALGLYMGRTLADEDEVETRPMEYYVTYLAGLLRSVRTGLARGPARARLVCLNVLREKGAVVRDPESGTYAVVPDAMESAVNELVREILALQADEDEQAAGAFVERFETMPDPLQSDLVRLDEEEVPVEVAFEQGPSVLKGLSSEPAAR